MAEAAGPLGRASRDRVLPWRRWWTGWVGREWLARMVAPFGRRGVRGRWVVGAFGAFLLGCALAVSAAQPAKKSPSWAELTPEQQEILAPLAGEWDKLEPTRKKKWLGIAKRYPKMTPTGQKRTQTRMKKWVELSPEQRREAREKYRSLNKLPPEQRQDLSKRWAEYQALTPAERQKVAPPASDSRSTKRRRTAKSGASEATTYREW